jgi:hypothetical protein
VLDVPLAGFYSTHRIAKAGFLHADGYSGVVSHGAVSSSRPEISLAVGVAAVKDGRQAAALAARSVLEGGHAHRQAWTGRNPAHAAARICCFLCSRRSSLLR